MIFYILATIGLVGIDQGVKAWVVAKLAVGQTRTLIPGVLSLNHIKNTGAAFSLFEGKQWLFYVVTVLSLGFVVYLWRTGTHNLWYRGFLTLIVAGTIGNFIDRVWHKEVTDMFQLDFMNFAIFNVADLWLTIGVIGLLIYLLFFETRQTNG